MIFDLHNDFPTALGCAELADYISRNSSLATVTAAVWTDGLSGRRSDRVREIIVSLRRAGHTGPIAIEDIGFIAEEKTDFDLSGLFYCSLTWNFNNAFAGGALDDGELTATGKAMIGRINAAGCVLDAAHLNKKSFYQAAEVTEKIMVSHTGFNEHPRSLDDRQIRLLVERKALIGLSCVASFSGAHDPRTFVEVIDLFVQKYGADCLGLGTDFLGSDDIPDGLNGYERIEALAEMFKRRGYAQSDIDAIFYRNAQTFYLNRG